MNKSMRELIKKLSQHGYKVSDINYKGKHPKLCINNQWLIVSKTPSSKGSYKKSLSYLRREGV